ncbi:MAG: Ethanolamine utilization protein EutN [Chloroflexi bacterium ADurb.Bin180]|nr:MAG: Ethanolamine utilization protein EutN [Chloroflexi bacterium ADurb.Bin180]HOU24827.1 EutN/CcmL family microcompartment protein [Anaerolineae bacterium]HQJ50941.1 EutN/CcmL family microcompartment protein [Anaerolineae bacterium]
MYIGKVVGTVVATRREARFQGLTLLLVRRVEVDLSEHSGVVLAVDTVGSGIGDYVLYATGSSARQTEITTKRPVDAVIMAIIDRWDIGNQLVFHKAYQPELEKPA